MPYQVMPIDKVVDLGRANPRYIVQEQGFLGSLLGNIAARHGQDLVEYAALNAGMNVLAEQGHRYVGPVPGNEDDYLAFWKD